MDNQPTAPVQTPPPPPPPVAPQSAPSFSYVNESFQQPNQPGSKKSIIRWLPKIFLVLFVAVIGYELFIAAKTFTTPPPTPAKVLPLSNAKISLLAEKKDPTGRYLQSTIYRSGDGILVNIRLDTGGHTVDAVDSVVHFDATLLEATGSGIIKGTIFDQYPLTRVDNTKGEVRVSGISSEDKGGFNGAGIFATLLFRAKGTGEAVLTSDFRKGATDDSNVMEFKTTNDILEGVNDLSLTITK